MQLPNRNISGQTNFCIKYPVTIKFKSYIGILKGWGAQNNSLFFHLKVISNNLIYLNKSSCRTVVLRKKKY